MKYKIFTRTWWRENSSWPNGLEPCPGEKKYIKTVDSYDEARNYCMNNNRHSLPENNRLSLKYEFEED